MSLHSSIWLLADDSEDDFYLLRRALHAAAPTVTLQWVKDGLQAKSYLLGEKPFDNRTAFPLPGLLLLDVKMPRCTGLELLAWLRTQPDLCTIPACVLSASNAPLDMVTASELGARLYLVKPGHPVELAQMVRQLARF
jgi:CheY-like chemotaxis protein